MIIKVLSVINSCETMGQLDTAVRYVNLAGKSKRISVLDWDLAFTFCQERLRQITKEMLTA